MLFCFSASRAGGWTQAPGEGYTKLSLRWQVAHGPFSDYRNRGRQESWMPSYDEVFVVGYGEFGVLDRVTVVANWPMLTSFAMAEPDRFRWVGVGDPSVGARIGVVQERFVLSVQSIGTAPVAPAAVRHPFSDVHTGREVGVLRVGAGVWDWSNQLQVGWGTGWGHVGAQAGVRLRSGGYAAVGDVGFELGWSASKRLYTSAKTGWVGPVLRGSAPYDESPSGIGNGARYLYYTGEIELHLSDRVGIAAMIEAACCYARQGGGPVVSVALTGRPHLGISTPDSVQ